MNIANIANIASARRAAARQVLAAAIAVMAWYPALGMAHDASFAKYRCVQGDTSQCEPASRTPDVRIDKQIVLGPYARYLVHRNESPDAAALKAQAFGEYAIERTVKVTRRNLSHLEKYERARDGLPASDTIDETLAEVPVDARDHRVVSLLRD
jgi:hypothetical protein